MSDKAIWSSTTVGGASVNVALTVTGLAGMVNCIAEVMSVVVPP